MLGSLTGHVDAQHAVELRHGSMEHVVLAARLDRNAGFGLQVCECKLIAEQAAPGSIHQLLGNQKSLTCC